ncbi:MAG: hypothetical protein ACQETP_11095, partial [Bacteroidota bacterium]
MHVNICNTDDKSTAKALFVGFGTGNAPFVIGKRTIQRTSTQLLKTQLLRKRARASAAKRKAQAQSASKLGVSAFFTATLILFVPSKKHLPTSY